MSAKPHNGLSPRGLIGALRRSLNGATAGSGVALRALWGNKLRASLTTLGIVIGVGTVIGILSIIHGMNVSFQDSLDRMGARSLYISQMPWIGDEDWFLYRNRPPITDWQYRRVRELVPFAEAVAPTNHEHAKIEAAGEQINDVRLLGSNAEYVQVAGVEVEFGRFFSAADVDHIRRYVVLGSETAQKLFGRADPLMKQVRIRGTPYTVVGVFKPQGSFLGQSRDNNAVIPISCFNRAFGWRRSLDIGIKISDGMELKAARDEITGVFRRIRGLRPGDRDNFAVNEQEQLAEMYQKLTGTLYLVIVGVSLISLVVGGIGIMNIMLVSVTERTREIGVRKALGARRRTVMFQFLVESLALSAVGGAIGVALGFLAAYVVDATTPLPAAASFGAVLTGLGFSSFIGIFFGLYPAWRASRLDPIEALRYE